MKQIADWALGMAVARGASHAEARIVDERERALGTRNGRVAVASENESLGLGVRVLAEGGWGFAATQELTRREWSAARRWRWRLRGLRHGCARAGAAGGRAGGGGGVEHAVRDRSVCGADGGELRAAAQDRRGADGGGGGDAGGDQHDLPALRAVVLQHGGRGDSPDADDDRARDLRRTRLRATRSRRARIRIRLAGSIRRKGMSWWASCGCWRTRSGWRGSAWRC